MSHSSQIKGNEEADGEPPNCEVHISYHNGDHYNSVRRAGDHTCVPANVRLMVRSSLYCKQSLSKISKPTVCSAKVLKSIINQALPNCLAHKLKKVSMM